jgi:hypothetical protein
VDDLRSEDMPTFGAPTIAEVAVEEFGFRPQMILG